MKVSLDELEQCAKSVSTEDPSELDWQRYLRVTGPAYVSDMVEEIRRLRQRETLLFQVATYADSVCGMLRQGGWPGKAEALESRIKAVIDFGKENV